MDSESKFEPSVAISGNISQGFLSFEANLSFFKYFPNGCVAHFWQELFPGMLPVSAVILLSNMNRLSFTLLCSCLIIFEEVIDKGEMKPIFWDETETLC